MTDDSPREFFYLPIELAELLHATLGPLCDVLERESHPWAAMVKAVIREYTTNRDQLIEHLHGKHALPEVAHHTYLAAERVCDLTEMAIREEEDFLRWTSELNGEKA